MSKDWKRILITLRCEQCGVDLEFSDAAVVRPKHGTTLCEKCFANLHHDVLHVTA